MEENIVKTGIILLLLLCSIQDMKKKKVSLWVVGLGILCILFLSLIYGTISHADRIGGFAVGVSIVLLSKATGGKIGMGDGLLLCATGIGLGLWGNLELFAVALFIAAVVSIVLLIVGIVNRKTSIPFIPFLFMGYIAMMAIQY
ncbi:MAG: putative rane protein [Herbinix sp.]|jgi:leader peptidase (prepilin peptidase)/N-methyltransferase|nr:putative rane protein [Herbinix sp.]